MAPSNINSDHQKIAGQEQTATFRSKRRRPHWHKLVGIFVLMTAGFALAFWTGYQGGRITNSDDPIADNDPAAAWTCSMHPQVKLPGPGKCPICFMDLIPLAGSRKSANGPRNLQMTPAAMALAGCS